MPILQQLIEGLDPTPLPTFGASEALQMVRNAYPTSTLGWIVSGAVAPDLLNNPWMASYCWRDTSTVPPTLRFFDGLSWQAFGFGNNSILGDAILDHSLVLTLKGAGFPIDPTAQPFYLLRIDAGGGLLEWVSPANAFPVGAIPANRLAPGGAGQFMRTLGGVSVWSSLTPAQVLAIIGLHAIDVRYLTPAADPYSIIRTKSTGTEAEWKKPEDVFEDHSIPVNKLNAVAANVGAVPMKQADGNVDWTTNIIAGINIQKFDQTDCVVSDGVGGTYGNWTAPASVYKVRVRAWGGGGGGGAGCPSGGPGGGGGGSGEYREAVITVVPGNTYTIQYNPTNACIGGIAVPVTAPLRGHDVLFREGPTLGSILLEAKGGNPAGGANYTLGGDGGVGGAGTIGFQGGTGRDGAWMTGDYQLGGNGGNAPSGGQGGGGSVPNSIGSVTVPRGACYPGGGGGGGQLAQDGGQGANGLLIIEW